MSVGRNHHLQAKGVRDVNGDYIKAYLAEHEKFIAAGRHKQAEACAVELRALGHEVKTPAVKERAVSPEPLEKAVEDDAPKRRGRPKASE